MKKFLGNKKGMTLLEGLIALMLLAVVATGTFGVLLSTSRKASTPSIREEMSLAVEQALSQLQLYVRAKNTDLPDSMSQGLCGNDADPLGTGNHAITCLLPPTCDKNNSSFSYTVGGNAVPTPVSSLKSSEQQASVDNAESFQSISFDITCNGFSL